MDYRKELEKALANGAGDLNSSSLDAYKEICCGCVLVAEDNVREQKRQWENAGLCRTFLHYAEYLEGFDHLLDLVNTAIGRMAAVISDHPRLSLRLLRLQLQVVRRLECIHGHELSAAEDLEKEIRFIERNIEFADAGDLDNVRENGHLHSDPVEWTERWEEVIDDADRICEGELAGHPRGMGFCHAFWQERASVLRERFGIEWRSPALMNPGVIFD